MKKPIVLEEKEARVLKSFLDRAIELYAEHVHDTPEYLDELECARALSLSLHMSLKNYEL